MRHSCPDVVPDAMDGEISSTFPLEIPNCALPVLPDSLAHRMSLITVVLPVGAVKIVTRVPPTLDAAASRTVYTANFRPHPIP